MILLILLIWWVIGFEVFFILGYVSEIMSEEESDVDWGFFVDKLKDGICELNNFVKIEKFNVSGSLGFNESFYNMFGV